jgi:hypothetical protein
MNIIIPQKIQVNYMTTKTLYVLACVATVFFLPGNNLMAGSRKELPNEMNIELAGKCLLYSFSYQRMVTEPLGVEIGVSLLGGGSSSSSSSILFFTGGGKLYFIQKNASPYVGGGIVAVTATTSSGPFSSNGSESYGYVGPGFEFRSEGGVLFRGSVYALIASGGFFIWPGLSIGIAF